MRIPLFCALSLALACGTSPKNSEPSGGRDPVSDAGEPQLDASDVQGQDGGEGFPDAGPHDPDAGAAPAPFIPSEVRSLRAPAFPLIASDPYFSVWSFSDTLCGSWPRHWTGSVEALVSMLRVDGTTYRLMGEAPSAAPCAEQTAVYVTPTRTVYEFKAGTVDVRLSFFSPTFANDLELVSRPVAYLTWDVRANDGQRHDVAVYFDNSAELAVNEATQEVNWEEVAVEGLLSHRIGTTAQPVLGKKGDDLRIDWGYLYQATARGEGVSQTVASDASARDGFVASGSLPALDARKPRAASDAWPVLATSFQLPGTTGEWSSRTLVLAYDDEFSIEYMGTRLRPYWRKDGAIAVDLLTRSIREYPALFERAKEFDAELSRELASRFGADFLRVALLSYRQAFAAHKLTVGLDGTPLFFSKENFSNGCIATVDITYPSAPLFLWLNPTLLKGMLTPVADYAASPRWKFDFAPHDLGTYPLANGQVYGGGESSEDNQMPVEESGNMLLLFAAVARADGNLDYVTKYLPLLAKWAAYLETQGFDPASQLSTDDFAGHLAHNVNLSAKAIVALGAYGKLLQQTNQAAEGARILTVAQGFADEWVRLADDGDHTRLAFDKPGTWSQKYNLVWDKILDLHLFPAATFEREAAFARTRLEEFGLPLDSRMSYTKLDWTVWTATLTGEREDFDALVGPLARFLDRTESRVPLTDWYETVDAKQVGFQARSVVGGVFLPVLYDDALWQKWAARSR